MNTPTPDRPTVAVIGGGYGGTVAARALDDVADVVLVEPRDRFVHNIGALRAAVDPEWAPRIFLPYDQLLEHGRVIRDRAADVSSPSAWCSGSGEELRPDYLILATGSSYPFPAKSDVDEAEEAQAKYRALQAELAAADSVLLLGAGPVGIELAGEISAALAREAGDPGRHRRRRSSPGPTCPSFAPSCAASSPSATSRGGERGGGGGGGTRWAAIRSSSGIASSVDGEAALRTARGRSPSAANSRASADGSAGTAATATAETGALWATTAQPVARNSPAFSIQLSERIGSTTIFVVIAMTQLTQ